MKKIRNFTFAAVVVSQSAAVCLVVPQSITSAVAGNPWTAINKQDKVAVTLSKEDFVFENGPECKVLLHYDFHGTKLQHVWVKTEHYNNMLNLVLSGESHFEVVWTARRLYTVSNPYLEGDLDTFRIKN